VVRLPANKSGIKRYFFCIWFKYIGANIKIVETLVNVRS
jgi:hypothetical protein